MVKLDWHGIRPLNGAQSSGFEELCTQIARSISPKGSNFVPKGAPDGGVECYTVLNNEKEWGWQAKYFDTLENSQWKQLDKSVRTALDKHPALVKYYICVPLDRPDARIENRQSCMERWKVHQNKWSDWAKENGSEVEFVWWGSSELLELLSEPCRAKCVSFWFDTRYFTNEWFYARLNEALASAGPRYTPELNVDLTIKENFEAFCRTEPFLNSLKMHVRSIRKKVSTLCNDVNKLSDSDITNSSTALSSSAKNLIDRVSALYVQPAGKIPFQEIIDQILETQTCTKDLNALLGKKEREQNPKSSKDTLPTSNPYRPTTNIRETINLLRDFSSALHKAKESFEHGSLFANSSLMLLTGEAGTGKTHLLCDVARMRIEAGQPTLLLMGQLFVGNTDPWTQILGQLDLRDQSVEQIIGALEAAAQSANCRALVLVDALNEGEGRNIWPNHLAAFLTQLQRSEWISVVLSVRSSYVDQVIPEATREEATNLVHDGFANHEYDATKTFFVYHGLELPSTPLLSPEFRNPLFLKTLCLGLEKSGQHRLPRGFHGISQTFDLYLSAINEDLAKKLDYNPKLSLVKKALNSFVQAIDKPDKPWLDMNQAIDIVNAFLPGRDYARSLYRGLVSERILIEESIQVGQNNLREEMVFISYERLADHLIARHLLDTHLDSENPENAFASDGPLAFVYDKNRYLPTGLVEAMCIQLPERTGKELASLAPKITESRNFRGAFRQSLVWRAMTAFSDDTLKILQNCCKGEYDFYEALDVLLTVTSIPGHPLNADFLDKRLSKDSMPERDSWWSTYLYRSFGNNGAVDRLVDWAASVDSERMLDNDAVRLCAITLTWMLTTSNRFLRDRATKALVSLLTGRISTLLPLLDRFQNVNDPYVLERLYAAVYGVAMRSHDSKDVGSLAKKVYEHIFDKGTPPAHILLRDYARGTVERALYLGARICIDESRIRPPYGSPWPKIPSEEEIVPLLPDLSSEVCDSGKADWARHDITKSVLHDDFARYVIGTNSGHSRWLSVRLSEPCWLSPDERLKELIDSFSPEERTAYEGFGKARDHLLSLQRQRMFSSLEKIKQDHTTLNEDTPANQESSELDNEDVQAKKTLDEALSVLESVLSDEQKTQLDKIFTAKNDRSQSFPPYFDLKLIQRYVLWRVFDLGWTTELFGDFERFFCNSAGRSASKAERIGKKYQWIAYHEIMALVADNFQFFEGYGDECIHQYDGPWQLSLRDIDPSCTLHSTPGGTKWDGHCPAWWAMVDYGEWGDDSEPEAWVVRKDNLPSLKELIRVQSPDDGTYWLNLHGFLEWTQPVPPEEERNDVERRNLWYIFNAYLIHKEDLQPFMDWAKENSFAGRWMPEPRDEYLMFLGEHGWSPASHCLDLSSWCLDRRNCPIEFRPVSLEFLKESTSFDCSIDETYTLQMPDKSLMQDLGLKWDSRAANFVDDVGKIVCMDPTAYAAGPTALLIREDSMREYLEREQLAIVWAAFGEKEAFGPGHSPEFIGELSISGAYTLAEEGLEGFLNCTSRLAKDEVKESEDKCDA